jgi:hypothetical protein
MASNAALSQTRPVPLTVQGGLPGPNIAADGSYRDQIAKLISKYPNLKYQDPQRFNIPTSIPVGSPSELGVQLYIFKRAKPLCKQTLTAWKS